MHRAFGLLSVGFAQEAAICVLNGPNIILLNENEAHAIRLVDTYGAHRIDAFSMPVWNTKKKMSAVHQDF